MSWPRLCESDNIKRMIILTVIALSSAFCNFIFRLHNLGTPSGSLLAFGVHQLLGEDFQMLTLFSAVFLDFLIESTANKKNLPKMLKKIYNNNIFGAQAPTIWSKYTT